MLHKVASVFVTVEVAVLQNVAVSVFSCLALNANRVLAMEFFARPQTKRGSRQTSCC